MIVSLKESPNADFKPYTLSLHVENLEDHAMLVAIFSSISGLSQARRKCDLIADELMTYHTLEYSDVMKILNIDDCGTLHFGFERDHKCT